MNPPPLPPKLIKEILGKSLDDAKTVANRFGYRLEVLVPILEDGEETNWVLVPSRYDSRKLNVELDESGYVVSVDY